MRPSNLERHLAKVEELLATIDECEAYLDVALGIEDQQAIGAGVISVVPLQAPTGVRFDTDEELAAAVADKIRRERQLKGWRQKDLADATGMARPNIARLESGRRVPSVLTLQRLAEALDIAVEDLLRPVS